MVTKIQDWSIVIPELLATVGDPTQSTQSTSAGLFKTKARIENLLFVKSWGYKNINWDPRWPRLGPCGGGCCDEPPDKPSDSRRIHWQGLPQMP